MTGPAPLRLLAEDADDLAIISAALQDAVAKVGDIHFDARGHTLTVAFNRFCWERDRTDRVRSGLQLSSVMNVKVRNIRRDAPEAVLELLTIAFEPAEAPGGAVVFTFAGGGDLRCEVECVEAVLADISRPWPARGRPAHEG